MYMDKADMMKNPKSKRHVINKTYSHLLQRVHPDRIMAHRPDMGTPAACNNPPKINVMIV